jgi:hypothetical protein
VNIFGNPLVWQIVCGLSLLTVTHPAGAGVVAESDNADQWAFQSLGRPEPPQFNSPWVQNEVDRFVLAKLIGAGIDHAPEADRRTLIRRVTFDLIGMAPTADEVEAFANDASANAYERLVNRLLESKHYGEHWARHWLDVVRYSDSNGFKSDEYRPLIWKYRDWVIEALNNDMPYDEFVQLQVAGDELRPDDPSARVATGFLRLWPYESNQRNVPRHWGEILDNVTDITGDVFLGVSVSCAKCHDHKFDPIKQRDYYALRSFFSSIYPDTELKTSDAGAQKSYSERLEKWREITAPILSEMDKIRTPIMSRLAGDAVSKFAPEIQAIWNKPASERTARDRQVRLFIQLQIKMAQKGAMTKLKDGKKKRWEALTEQLAFYDDLKPQDLPGVMAIRNAGPNAAPTFIPGKENVGDVAPAFLSALIPGEKAADIALSGSSTGRRSALAQWLTSPDNPLTTRVIANRAWHYLFGRGIVATTNDFGKEGARPSHPELLDWLARYLPENGWSLKELNRLLVTSATYRQASQTPASSVAAAKDPDNDLLWRMRVRRLTSEQMRDAMLVASGELDGKMGGPGVADTTKRRAVYQKIMRNDRPDFMATFDGPDTFNSCARRDVTTTPTQALFLLNNDWSVARGDTLARAIKDDADPVGKAYGHCFGHAPSDEERSAAETFIATQTEETSSDSAMADFCHALLNANEFLYLD